MERLRDAVHAAAQAAGVSQALLAEPAFRSLVDSILVDFDHDDADGDTAAAIGALARRMWSFADVRPAAEDLVRVGTSIPGEDGWMNERTYVDVVTTDKPFLIDSISDALADRGLFIEFLAHPLVEVTRAPDGRRASQGERIVEAMIHIELDPVLDDAQEKEIEEEIRDVLADIRCAVSDWPAMMARMSERIAQLESREADAFGCENRQEAVAFLKWLRDGKFAFLGSRRFYHRPDRKGEEFRADHEQGLGLLRTADRRVLRRTEGATAYNPAIRHFMEGRSPILVAKANFRSTVHRRVHMDYIGVKRFGPDGRVDGEDRFVGLFTSEAYVSQTADVPLVRAKVADVMRRADFPPDSHNAKALRNILETYPRDELFQATVEEIEASALGMLRLKTRPRCKVFVRRDPFDRFVSILVFVPREQFNSRLREMIGDFLCDHFKGRLSAYYPTFGDAPLARIHYIVGGVEADLTRIDVAALDAGVARLALGWEDEFANALRTEFTRREAAGLYERYARGFGPGYRELYNGAVAVRDVKMLEKTPGAPNVAIRAYIRSDGELGAKLYRADSPAPLSDVLPILENLGARVLEEAGSEINLADGVRWIHDFNMVSPKGREKPRAGDLQRFEDAFRAVWSGHAENDRFNTLVLAAGLTWREAAILRAFARYHQQAGSQYTPAFMARTLAKHAAAARAVIALFAARFDPDFDGDEEARRRTAAEAADALAGALDRVDRLDEDRILRRFKELVDGLVRTNVFQTTPDGGRKPVMSFKIDPARLESLPKPKPYREIFVYSPRVEGVHLRFGPVARGGLRWSDRREDYRTEVLGLAKAQRVKNAVIVPSGAKGGFYPKRSPTDGDRDAVFEEGRGAYKDFIGGLLDLTDNLQGGDVAPPERVVRLDGDDPYLVVAADKGTATFSDTANAIAEARGFWLGDAFASGGSKGYDHKVMGITAKGGWEAVKRHFREMARDIQNEPFTVIGVGDMSGDVFGNGMLLSKHIRLLAAFDHRDIFLDPNPDETASWNERKRLFDLGRSSWRDYDPALISKGGGVLSRSAKSVSLTPEMRALIGLDVAEATPFDVLRALLAMKADLLWFGGIGTYVKAKAERHADVGDRANDAIRVDAEDLRAAVIGEGANLGITQAGRIAFAKKGGRINTDAIDNSAGVDSSDHEVNIKILLNRAMEEGALKREDRDALLAEMTDDVSRLVLLHNFDQTGGLSLIASHAKHDLEAHRRLIRILEQEGRIDRALDGLPSEEEIADRLNDGLGLVRPEIAVLLANVKIRLKAALLTTDLPDDPCLDEDLRAYFPPQLGARFAHLMRGHRLNRDIVATRVANNLVDIGGMTLFDELTAATGASLGETGKAVYVGREVFDLRAVVARIDAMDLKAPADLQFDIRGELVEILRRHALWLLSKGRLDDGATPGELIGRYREAARHIVLNIDDLLTRTERVRFDARVRGWVDRGAPEDLAKDVAALRLAASGPLIAETAAAFGRPLDEVASVFAAVGAAIGLDRLRSEARAVATNLNDSYEEYAVRRLVDELTHHQAQLAGRIIRVQAEDDACASAELWVEANPAQIEPLRRALDALLGEGELTVAKLSLAEGRLAEAVRRLV